MILKGERASVLKSDRNSHDALYFAIPIKLTLFFTQRLINIKLKYLHTNKGTEQLCISSL